MKHRLLILMTVLLSSCGTSVSGESSIDSDVIPMKGTIDNSDIAIFPKSIDGYIGDPMPYFDGTTMNIYYLLQEDNRSGVGFHPWSLLTTDDLVSYEDVGVVIPYDRDVASPDLALGTGSVIKDTSGLYHAFYTGYNGTGNLDYHEKIQHATSSDKVNWTKIPEHGFYGGQNDFRDPYVFYMESEGLYWMLITTRDAGGGVIKLYKSINLINWNYDSIFFRNDSGSYNMECPTLIKFNDYWYLTYSEQGAHRVTHYRYRNDLNSGEWIKPANDYFDGSGVYAGRVEKAWDRLFFFAWQAIKQYDYDGGEFDWSGNLVTHELKQKSSGELYVKPTEEIKEAINTQVFYPLSSRTEGGEISEISTSNRNQTISFSGSQYESVLFESLEEKPTRLDFKVNSSNILDQFGLTFTVKNENSYGATNILFNRQTSQLEFYNVAPSSLDASLPQARIPLEINNSIPLGVTVLMESECVSVYIDGQFALSARMYQKSGLPFGFFSLHTNIDITDIAFYE